MNVGFRKFDFFDLVKPAFDLGFSDITLADELSLIVLALRQDVTTVVVFTADLESFTPAAAVEIRTRIAAGLHLPLAQVLLFATQNHCVPMLPIERNAEFADRCVVAAQAAIAAAEPAEMLHASVHPEPPLNFCRRVHLPDLGAFSFWGGYRTDGPGRPDVGHLLDLSLQHVARGEAPVRRLPLPANLPIPSGARTVLLDRAADDALQAVFFRSLAGAPIGAFLRFAVHPCTGEPPGNCSRYSGDFPVFARRGVERAFGGTAMFLTGPCGDANPLIERRSQALAEQFGAQVAAAALVGLTHGAWQKPQRLLAREVIVELPVRSDFPTSSAAVAAEIADLAARLKEPHPPVEHKRRLDRMELLQFYRSGTFARFTGNAETDLCPDALIRHPLPILAIGETVIAGLPGEPFNAYSVRLRRETGLGESLIVCDQANGYVGYIPTAVETTLGGYGVNFSLFDARAEAILIAALKAEIARLPGK
ncbi:MAG: hypothetical protein ACREJ2_02870 [Planctomycetota bacterium]